MKSESAKRIAKAVYNAKLSYSRFEEEQDD